VIEMAEARHFVPQTSFCLFEVVIQFKDKPVKFVVFNGLTYCALNRTQLEQLPEGTYKDLSFAIPAFLEPGCTNLVTLKKISGPIINCWQQWLKNNGDYSEPGFGSRKDAPYQRPTLTSVFHHPETDFVPAAVQSPKNGTALERAFDSALDSLINITLVEAAVAHAEDYKDLAKWEELARKRIRDICSKATDDEDLV